VESESNQMTSIIKQVSFPLMNIDCKDNEDAQR